MAPNFFLHCFGDYPLQCRLLMKMYAFVRSNVPRALRAFSESEIGPETRKIAKDENENGSGLRKRVNGTRNACGLEVDSARKNGERSKVVRKQESWISFFSEDDEKCPSYSRYLYFFFAPTLIYKDKYPRQEDNP